MTANLEWPHPGEWQPNPSDTEYAEEVLELMVHRDLRSSRGEHDAELLGRAQRFRRQCCQEL
eukprot:500643-Prorocentrum_lima.AAC.1